MHVLKDRGFELPSSEITPRAVHEDRRRLLTLMAGAALGGWARDAFAQAAHPTSCALPGVRKTASGAQTWEDHRLP
jgi:hypothetical protein